MNAFYNQNLIMSMPRTQVKSFDAIMADLHSMKQELLRMHYAYSPQAANYHQIEHIASLKSQVLSAQEKLAHFQSQFQQRKQGEGQRRQQLQSQNQELMTINEQLVLSNQKFQSNLESLQRKRTEVEQMLAKERDLRRSNESKLQKELQNLRLTHAQQLYMLRKKQKKERS